MKIGISDIVMTVSDTERIRTFTSPTCALCGSKGEKLYENLTDNLFGVSGLWSFRKCPNYACQLIWLDPMPFLEDIPKLYAHYYTHESRKESGFGARLYNSIRDSVLASCFDYKQLTSHRAVRLFGRTLGLIRDIKDRAGSDVMWLKHSQRARLLDIGCGSGQFIAFMRDLGWVVTGVEPDQDAVCAANELFGVKVLQGYPENINFPEGVFDAITMNHVIEHISDPARVLRLCTRFLVPGGQIIIVTPNTSSLGHVRFGRDWRGLEPPRHIYLYNPKSIRKLAETAGLKVQDVRTVAKGAIYFLTLSGLIRKSRISGSSDRHEALLSQARRKPLKCLLNQIWESVVLSVNQARGEEILLVAEKTLER
jgi:2-polyprenyl-3-methyl-5-hydroxy-6-metoxy-1,4-benzoquinol methylase